MDHENKPEIKQILAIDYGVSKVGLALADSETRIAFAYGTLPNDKNFFQKLAGIIEEKNVQTIIVGIPTYLKHEKEEYVGETIGKKIKELFPFLEVEYHDEMFTTKIAQDNLIQKKVKNIKKYDDQEAARVILQSWLEQKNV